MTRKQKKTLIRIIVAAALLLFCALCPTPIYLSETTVLDVAVVASWPPSPRFFGVGVVPAELTGIGQEMTFYFLNRLYLYLLAYLIIGWDILWKAVRNIGHGQVFDENFLMGLCLASP